MPFLITTIRFGKTNHKNCSRTLRLPWHPLRWCHVSVMMSEVAGNCFFSQKKANKLGMLKMQFLVGKLKQLYGSYSLFVSADFSDWWLMFLLWNYPHDNITGHYWWQVKISSGKSMVLPGIEPLPKSILILFYVAIWGHWAAVNLTSEHHVCFISIKIYISTMLGRNRTLI